MYNQCLSPPYASPEGERERERERECVSCATTGQSSHEIVVAIAFGGSQHSAIEHSAIDDQLSLSFLLWQSLAAFSVEGDSYWLLIFPLLCKAHSVSPVILVDDVPRLNTSFSLTGV